MPERKSWQPRILAIKDPRQNYWLVDTATDVHVCNNQRLITEYTKKHMRVGGFIADGILPGGGNIKIRLAKKYGSEALVLTWTNDLYLPNRLSNLVSLDLLNDVKIFHHNKDQILSWPKYLKEICFCRKVQNQLSSISSQPILNGRQQSQESQS